MGKRDKGQPRATAAKGKSSNRTKDTSTAAGPSKISDQLRQAVKDLGGDEEDLRLIEGIDDEEDETPAKSISEKGKGKEAAVDERSLRKALGEFMKELDFSVAPVQEDSGDEEESEEEGGSAEEKESDDSDSDEKSSHEEEGSTSESSVEDDTSAASMSKAKAEASKEPAKAAETLTEQSVSNPADKDPTSGTNVPASPSWSTITPPLDALSKAPKPPTPAKLDSLRQRANHLLETLPPLSRASSSADAAFISQVLHSGTHQDKLSALVLLVRESPIHAVKELNRLRSMAGWKEDGLGGGGNKDQRLAVLKALADWWITGGGKEAGKLKYFADQPLLAHPGVTDRHLLVFAFEDYLKKWFFNLLQVLEFLSHDTLSYVRTQTLHTIFQLLSGNAEQEQNLLRLGVNKLGDMDRSVASKTSHHILQLLQVHPAMKAVIAREVSALILKPASTQSASAPTPATHIRFDEPSKSSSTPKNEGTNHARYYGLITLNQITLTSKDQATAARMVELYFEVFREILGSNDDADGAAGDEAAVKEKVTGKVEKWRGRRKGAKPKGGRKTAQESENTVESGEAKLVAAVLTGINRALPFAKLDDELLKKYMDTLFKITHRGTFNTSIQSLNLIHTVSRTQASVADRFYRTLYDSLFDERLVTSSKQAMYLNLLFKALKSDTNQSRVMAFVKRLLQMLGMQQPPFICGALYLLGELFTTVPGLRRMLLEPEEDEVEHFVDADRKPTADERHGAAAASSSKSYDGKKREPQYANADTSCLWELLPFLDHFHPSVSLQATQLLNSLPITGSSDISLNTLVSFLDRFVYRNPKKNLQPKGASIMQPAAAGDRSGMVVMNKGARAGDSGFVNTESFWRKKIEDVPADQLFFHKFFSTKLAQKDAASKKAKSQKADDESGDESEVGSALHSDADEDEVWEAMKKSMPGAADDLDISDDSEISDLDEDDDEDEDEDISEAADDAIMSAEEEADSDLPSEDDEDSEDDDEEEAGQSDSGSESPFPDFADEEDDIISNDDEMPDIRLDASADEDDEDEEVSGEVSKGKRKRNQERKERRKKRKEMPVFGSYEDYAKLIEGNDDGEDVE